MMLTGPLVLLLVAHLPFGPYITTSRKTTTMEARCAQQAETEQTYSVIQQSISINGTKLIKFCKDAWS